MNTEASAPAPTSTTERSRIRLQDAALVLGRDPAGEVRAMRERGFVPPGRANLPPLPLRIPFPWDAGKSDPNWAAQINMLRMVDPLLALAAQGDDDCRRTATGLIRDWASANPPIGASGSGARDKHSAVAWRDRVTGIRASKIALLHDLSPTDDAASLRPLLTAHAQRLSTPGFIRHDNHGLSDLHGLRATAQALWDTDATYAAELIAFCNRLVDGLVATQFTKNGFHKENSPGYHALGVRLLTQMAQSGWYTSALLDDCISRITDKDQIFALPSGGLVPVGDTNRTTNTSPPSASWRRVNDADGYLVASRKGKPHETFFLMLNAFHHGRMHKHDDINAVFWSVHGQDLLIDAGKYAYVDDPYRRYVESSLAHSGPVYFDPQGEVIDLRDNMNAAEAQDMMAGATLDWTQGRVRMVNVLRSTCGHYVSRREVLLQTPRQLVLHDELRAPHGLGLNFLLPNTLTLERLEDQRATFRHGELTLLLDCDGGRLRHFLGNAEDEKEGPRGWASVGYGGLEPAHQLLLELGTGSARVTTRLTVEAPHLTPPAAKTPLAKPRQSKASPTQTLAKKQVRGPAREPASVTSRLVVPKNSLPPRITEGLREITAAVQTNGTALSADQTVFIDTAFGLAASPLEVTEILAEGLAPWVTAYERTLSLYADAGYSIRGAGDFRPEDLGRRVAYLYHNITATDVLPALALTGVNMKRGVRSTVCLPWRTDHAEAAREPQHRLFRHLAGRHVEIGLWTPPLTSFLAFDLLGEDMDSYLADGRLDAELVRLAEGRSAFGFTENVPERLNQAIMRRQAELLRSMHAAGLAARILSHRGDQVGRALWRVIGTHGSPLIEALLPSRFLTRDRAEALGCTHSLPDVSATYERHLEQVTQQARDGQYFATLRAALNRQCTQMIVNWPARLADPAILKRTARVEKSADS